MTAHTFFLVRRTHQALRDLIALVPGCPSAAGLAAFRFRAPGKRRVQIERVRAASEIVSFMTQ
jgi:hypothetical protein